MSTLEMSTPNSRIDNVSNTNKYIAIDRRIDYYIHIHLQQSTVSFRYSINIQNAKQMTNNFLSL